MPRLNASARRISPRLGAAIVIGALMAAFSAGPSLARENITMSQGVRACKAYCDRNNQTVGSVRTCYSKCERYWMCWGSDATAITCADKPPVVREAGPTPTTPTPPVTQGPGLVPSGQRYAPPR